MTSHQLGHTNNSSSHQEEQADAARPESADAGLLVVRSRGGAGDDDAAQPIRLRWLTLVEAADHARCSAVTIGRAARDGQLTGYKLRNRRSWRFRREDVDAWLMAAHEPLLYQPPVRARHAGTRR